MTEITQDHLQLSMAPLRPRFPGMEEAMNTRVAWLVCGIVLFGAYGVLALMTPSASGPPEIRLTSPPSDLSPKLAGLFGVWESAGDGGNGETLVVERINETRAVIVRFSAHPLPGHPEAGWERVVARVHRDGTIQWGYPVRFTLGLGENGATLETETEGVRAIVRTSLTKVGVTDYPGGATFRTILTKAVQ